VLSGGVCGNISAAGVKPELVLARQAGDKFLVRVRLRPTQLVVEVNYHQDNPEFLAEFEQKAQQRNGIHAARNRHTDAVPGVEQLLPPDVIPEVLREVVHVTIVQLWGRSKQRSIGAGMQVLSSIRTIEVGAMLTCPDESVRA